MEVPFLLALAVLAFSFLVWAPALLLGHRGRSRYTFLLIIALSVPLAGFAYAMGGYSGAGVIALVASFFLIANLPD